MIGKKICDSLIRIFEDDRNYPEAEKVVEEMAQLVGVNKLSVAIYEEGKDLF